MQQYGYAEWHRLYVVSTNIHEHNTINLRYVRDHPPCTLVTYVDPISLPLTKNDGVCETMVRSIQVSKEMKQK